MPVLDRSALEQSPLADLHAIASELSLDGYRRLRKADLIDAILERQGGEEEEAPGRRRRSRRSSRAKTTDDAAASAIEAEDNVVSEDATEAEDAAAGPEEEPPKPARRRRRSSKDTELPETSTEPETAPAAAEAGGTADERASGEPVAEGVVEVLPNGSAFLRVNAPEPSEDDVYISAAQVKRCELVTGDRIAGPRRAPRRSERFASLVRVDTINGRPASEVADNVRFDDLPCGFPVEQIRLGSDDATLRAIEFATPFGRGSRVSIVGAAQSGKSHVLRQLATGLPAQEDLQVLLVLAGVRPEEVGEWREGALEPADVVTLAASPDTQSRAVERVLDQARRLAARGSHVVLLIDTLSGLSEGIARRVLAAARRVIDGGSLTVIATASAPLGGETTVIALRHGDLASLRQVPGIDMAASWTMRAELLVGAGGAEVIAKARAEALDL